MSSTTETGHAKNVAIFYDLISSCTGFGVDYNPANPGITISALQALYSAASGSLQQVMMAKAAYCKVTNDREIAFKPLKSLATRIISALAASNATQLSINNAKTSNYKIQGRRVHAIKKTDTLEQGQEPPSAKTISVSHLSFDKQVDHFAQLITTLSGEPLYTPNEASLSLTGLNTLLDNLRAKNTGVINIITELSNARIVRNKTLYAPGTGMVDIALSVKSYIASVFGKASPEYKRVRGLKFKKKSIL